MNRFFLFLAPFCLSVLSLRAVDYQRAIDEFAADSAFRFGTVAVGLYDVTTGNRLAGHNIHQALMPASTTKLLPTAAALELLGGDYCFTTRLCHDGTVEADGTLRGNLYIVGSGDPTLGSSFVDARPDSFLVSWISQLKQRGIRRVSGAVVAIDLNQGSESTISGKWLWEDVANYYGAASYGLNVYDNSYRVVIRSASGGAVREITTEPKQPGLTLTPHLQVWNHPTDSIVIYPDYGRGGVVIEGALSTKEGTRSAKGAIPNPPHFLAHLLSQSLHRAGIGTGKTPCVLSCWNELTGEGGQRLQTLLTWKSPPLSDVCRQTNFRSLNLYAQALTQLVGRAYDPEGTRSAPQSLVSFWGEKGVPTGGAWLYDGSGLAPANRISVELLAGLLNYMGRVGKEHNAFMASLPVAGREGTVSGLFREGASSGWVRLKSGSMSGVVSYAGYITQGEKQYSLVIMVNQYLGKRADLTPKIETLLRRLTHDEPVH